MQTTTDRPTEDLQEPGAPLDVETLAETFRRDGYLIVPRFFDGSAVAKLRDAFQILFDAKVRKTGIRGVDRTDEKAGEPRDFRPQGGNHDLNRWEIRLPSRAPFVADELISQPDLVRLVTAILGADATLYLLGSDVAMPGCRDQVPHQDASTRTITVNIPLVDVDDTNGPTEVWPTTHRVDRTAPYSEEPRPLDEAGVEKLVEGAPSVRLTCPAGSLSIRDHRTIHRGTPNGSDAPRPVLSLYFAPAPRGLPLRSAHALVAKLAREVRKRGLGAPGDIRDPELLKLGNFLGFFGSFVGRTDRVGSKAIPRAEWEALAPPARRLLRYAEVEGRSSSDELRGIRGTVPLLSVLRTVVMNPRFHKGGRMYRRARAAMTA